MLRLAYAGESSKERRRVVNDDGREERESGMEDLEGCSLPSGGLLPYALAASAAAACS